MKEEVSVTDYLGKTVKVNIDRPLGSKHPKHGFNYPVNYGYIPETKAPDGEELDAYVLNENEALKNFEGECVAVLRRIDDGDDKLIVVKVGEKIEDEEIERETRFQEQLFKYKIIR